MKPTVLLPFRRKARWGFFSPCKIRRLRPGLNPRTWGPKASALTPRPPKPHRWYFQTQSYITLTLINSVSHYILVSFQSWCRAPWIWRDAGTCSSDIRIFVHIKVALCWSQWPRGLRRGSAAARLLRFWVRIPPGCMDVCLLSGRGLCDELITRQEESYRVCCVWMWSRNPVNQKAVATGGSGAKNRNKVALWLSGLIG
jgi:hypothetical protein